MMKQENQLKESYVSCAKEIADELLIYLKGNKKLHRLYKYDEIVNDFQKYRNLCDSFDLLHLFIQGNIKPVSDDLIKLIESQEMSVAKKLQIDSESKKEICQYIKLFIELSDDYANNLRSVTEPFTEKKVELITQPTKEEYDAFKKLLENQRI